MELVPTFDKLVLCLLATLTGRLSFDVLSNFMLVGNEGVNYYAEAHLSNWNAWIHTIFMPITIYGMLFWIPSLFNLNPTKAKNLILFLYFLYFGHYYHMSKINSILYLILYSYTVKRAINVYSYEYNKSYLIKNYIGNQGYLISRGLLISTFSLGIQEFVGHYLGGDIPSKIGRAHV